MIAAYFSPSLSCFIPSQWKDDGTYNKNTWPVDAIEATEIELSKYWKVSPLKEKNLEVLMVALHGWTYQHHQKMKL